MQVVGISGKAGSGKDYLAQHLFEPLGFKRWSFAWHLKVWVVAKGLATHEEVFVTKPDRVRTILQRQGTEEGRDLYGDSVWCTAVESWLRLLEESWGIERIVIPDVRFRNEVDMIHRLGGKVVRIHAPGRASRSGLSSAQRQHRSEVELDDYRGWDLILQNDEGLAASTPQQLEEAVRGAVQVWGWEHTGEQEYQGA